MRGFTFETTPRILCEDGASGRLASMLSEFAVTRPLLITDQAVADAGVLEPALASLSAASVTPVLHCGVRPAPTEIDIHQAVELARASGIDGVVGVGGGSCMDTAKLVALLTGSGQSLEAVYGVGRAAGPRLPLLQLPTTAGTGSEVSSLAVVTRPGGQKASVISRNLFPDLAVLDALLTRTLPPRMTAMAGIDAMVHAIEAFAGKARKNPVSDGLALKGLELLAGSIRSAVADGGDITARRAMLQGSLLAGMAFSNSPGGAVHALAHPIGDRFGVHHGHSNAIMLGPVLSFNVEAAEAHYAQLGRTVAPEMYFVSTPDAAFAFVRHMQDLVADMPFEQRLSDLGIARTDLENLAMDALCIQPILVNNPREVRKEDALALYLAAL